MSRMLTVMITGAAGGVGLALTQHFLTLNYKVIAVTRTPLPIKKQAKHPRLTYINCDIAQKPQVIATIRELNKKKITLFGLINNAGVAGANSLSLEDDDSTWEDIIATNVHGTYYMSKYALSLFAKNGGSIVNIASVLSHFGAADQTAYTTAKHGTLGFTRALAKYLAPRSITVNAICPGWVDTKMADKRQKELGMSWNQLLAAVPLKRKIKPEEVAYLAAFLMSVQARGITGQAYNLDGGVTA